MTHDDVHGGDVCGFKGCFVDAANGHAMYYCDDCGAPRCGHHIIKRRVVLGGESHQVFLCEKCDRKHGGGK